MEGPALPFPPAEVSLASVPQHGFGPGGTQERGHPVAGEVTARWTSWPWERSPKESRAGLHPSIHPCQQDPYPHARRSPPGRCFPCQAR